MSDKDKFDYVFACLWRKYGAGGEENINALRALADKIFEEASEMVTITSTSYEGGSASGQITFDKTILGAVVERILAQIDPGSAAFPGSGNAVIGRINFGARAQET